MSEASLKKYLRWLIGPYGEWQSIESPGTNEGIADIICSLKNARILIETKYKKSWPKRPSTGLKLDHFTEMQQNFLFRHGSISENGVFVILQVAHDIMIFPWNMVYEIEGKTKDQLRHKSILTWKRTETNSRSKFSEIRMGLLRVLSTF